MPRLHELSVSAAELGRRGGLARAARMAEKRALLPSIHPEKRIRRFPHKGTPDEQREWFRREFLRLAEQQTDPKERASLLKLAFATVAKSDTAFAEDDFLPAGPLPDLATMDGALLERLIGKSLTSAESVKGGSHRPRSHTISDKE